MKAMRKIIIKVGTSALTQGTQRLSRRFLLSLVQQMAHLQNRGLEFILVSSGAVATGKDLLDSAPLTSKQTLASVGQVKLMQVWAELFSLFDLQVGQVLLTKDDFSQQRQQLTRKTLDSLLEHQIVPIINENDAVITEGIGFGNNDSLAAWVAHVVEADTLILLTDQEGLYTADPRLHPHAQLISIVKSIDAKIYALATDSSTSLGTGGMATKIEAAQIASEVGAQTIITSASRPHVLIDLIDGKPIGTLFIKGKTS
jgi:glutamate 5-kinase